MISIGNRYTLGMGLRLHRIKWSVTDRHKTVPKTCGSVVDCSLVLFSIFGLLPWVPEVFLACMQREFSVYWLVCITSRVSFSFSFYLYIFCGVKEGVVKNVPLWAIWSRWIPFLIGTVCVCSSHDSLLLSGGICLDVIWGCLPVSDGCQSVQYGHQIAFILWSGLG